VAPSATAPESTDPKFHKAWKGLAAAEKANVEKGKALAVSEKKIAQWEAALAIEDPVARVEALAELSGKKDLFNLAAQAMVSRKKVDPGVSKALSEVELLKQDLHVARALPLVAQGASPEDVAAELGIDVAALEALVADKRHADRFQKANAKFEAWREGVLSSRDTEAREWVAAQKEPDGQPTYELIAAHGHEDKIFKLITQHHAATFAAGEPVILTVKEAADFIEAALEPDSRDLLQKLQGSRKLKPATPETAGKPPVPPPPASRPTSPKTLGNAAAQDSSAAALPMTEAQRVKAAERLLEAKLASRRTR
jgi:hypothetical protein